MIEVAQSTDEAGRLTLTLSGELVIRDVRAAHQALRAALGSAPDVILNLAEIREMDTAGLQLLISLRKESLAGVRRVTLRGHSPAVLALLDVYGLVSFFGDRIVLKQGERSNYGFRYGAGSGRPTKSAANF